MIIKKLLGISLILMIVGFSLSRAGAVSPALSTAVRPEQVPVLMYHKVSPYQEHGRLGLRITPENFEQQVKHLKSQGYNTVSLDRLTEHWETGTPLPARPVVLTFDDGYEDNYLFAYPVLKKYGYTATIFLVYDDIEGYNEWETDKIRHPTVKLLSWSQIREMQDWGISFQSHTLTHPSLTWLSPEKVQHEVAQSKTELENALGTPVNYFAYPYGRCNWQVAGAVHRAGYKAALTTVKGRNDIGTDRYMLKRLGVNGKIDITEFAQMMEGH